MKKLEAANAEQQQQQAQAQAQATATTVTLTEAQLAAAAYYQAQFMLLANSAASTPTTDDGSGTATMDSSALSEYYSQCLGYLWNDRTPTSSDAEDAGTPLPSNKEDEEEEQHPHAGEVQVSLGTRKPSELKTMDERTSTCKGERERRKVKRSRKHKRLSAEDASSTVSATETDASRGTCMQNKKGSYHKPSNELQENLVVRNDHKIRNSVGDNDRHQSDNIMETSTNTNTCTPSSTDRTGLMNGEKGRHSLPREKPLPKRHVHVEDQQIKEVHRMAQEPHREMKEAQREHGVQRLCSKSQSPTNSSILESMNNQHQFRDNSVSSHDVKEEHSTCLQGVNRNSCSPKGEKQSPRRQRREREKKDLQREIRKHRRESTDVQESVNDSHRDNHVVRSHSSSQSPHSPTGQKVKGQYRSSLLDGRSTVNTDTAAQTRAIGRISPNHHIPRIERHSPKRHGNDRGTNKPYGKDPHGEEVRQPSRETRKTHRERREEYAEIREGHQETKDSHRAVVGTHRETRETDRQIREMMKEPHREMKEQQRVMMEPLRVMKEAHKEIREPQRGMREAHRGTLEAYRDPRREPQSETMELRRDRRMFHRETRETYGDRESSHNSRSRSSSQLSCSRHRSRSPSFNKENIRRPPSLNRERQPGSGRANSLEKTSDDISSKRRLERKRKLSNSSQSASQHNRKQARRESYQQDVKKDRQHSRSSAMSSHEPSPKHTSHQTSPVCFSPDFDDIIAPPTPNADEILPYSTDVQLCENNTVLPSDDPGAMGNMSDIVSCPPTPTSELRGPEQTSNKDRGNKFNTDNQGDKPQANLNGELTNEETMKMSEPELHVDGGGNPLASEDNDTAVFSRSEPKIEDVVNDDEDKKEASDLEEGEITDSYSDSGNEAESATRKQTKGDDEPGGGCVKKKQVNISGNYRSQEVEKRVYCEELVDGRRPRSHESGSHQRHSHHHPPLSERRNRHSPPSMKKRTQLYNQDGHAVVKHSHSERHTHCHRSSRNSRSNLPKRI